MPRPIENKESVKIITMSRMQELGTYREEYDDIIGVYAGLYELYVKLFRKAKIEDYMLRNDTVLTIENIRKDLLQYANALGLSPAGVKKMGINVATKNRNVGKLDGVLNKYDK